MILALKSLEEALKILPASESGRIPAALEMMVACQQKLRRQSEAVATLSKIAGIHTKSGNFAELARIQSMMGEALLSKGEFQASLAEFNKALKLYRELNLNKEIYGTLLRAAYVSQLMGDLTGARKAMDEAQAMSHGADSMPKGLPEVVLGLVAYQDGKTELAVSRLSDALKYYEGSSDVLMSSQIRLNLANIRTGFLQFQFGPGTCGKGPR